MGGGRRVDWEPGLFFQRELANIAFPPGTSWRNRRNIYVTVVDFVEGLLDMVRLVLRQGQADDVHVVLRDGRRIVAPQPQPTSSNVVPGRSTSLPSTRSILAIRAASRVMSARSKCAAIGLRGVEEQLEEAVGQAVVAWTSSKRDFRCSGTVGDFIR